MLSKESRNNGTNNWHRFDRFRTPSAARFSFCSGVPRLLAMPWQANPISTILIDFNRLTRNSTILIIPLFTFAGYIIAEGKAPQRLVAFARASVGWLPGGIAVVVLGTCAFFTTFTGASGVTIIALGGLVLSDSAANL